VGKKGQRTGARKYIERIIIKIRGVAMAKLLLHRPLMGKEKRPLLDRGGGEGEPSQGSLRLLFFYHEEKKNPAKEKSPTLLRKRKRGLGG